MKKENKMRRIGSMFLLTVFLTPNLIAAAPIADSWIDNSLHASVTREGFAWMSGVLTESNLGDISQQPLPDVDEDMGLGIQGELTGLSYDIDFNHLEIVPTENSIAVRLHMNSITVRAARLKFVKRAGVTIRTTCEDIEIKAGEASSVDLFLQLEPQVENGQLRLVERDLRFDIGEDNFKIHGPRRCSGALGVGTVIGHSVRYMLGRSREKIVDAVRNRIRSTIPKMEESLNAVIATSFPISLGGGNVIAEHQLLVRGRPNSIVVNAQGLNAKLDVSVETKQFDFLAEDSKALGSKDLGELDPVVASVALQTELINQLLQYTVPNSANPLAIETSSSPANQIFSRSSISSILPDLNQLTLDSETIRASLSFGSPPRIATLSKIDGSMDLVLQCPDLHLLLSIEKDGQVIPYFDLKIDTTFGIRIAKDANSNIVALTVQSPEHVSVTGTWATNYHPQVEIFERDVAQVLFSSVMEYLFVAQPVFRMKAPVIAVGNSHSVEVAYPFATGDLVGISLSGR